MPFETGTATDYHDLMDKLRTFCVTTLGWTEIDYTNPTGDIVTPRTLALRPIGTGANRPILMFTSFANAPAGHYVWTLRIAEGYDSSEIPGSQLNVSPPTHTHFSGSTMTYWFYGNDRRIIVIGKIGTIYTSLYSGLFLPFAFPSEYIFPWIVIGNNSLVQDINVANSRNRFIVEPGFEAAQARLRNGQWIPIHNQANSTNAEPNYVTSLEGGFMWPSRTSWDTSIWRGAGTSSGASFDQVLTFGNFRPNASGELPLFQAHIWQRASSLGQFIGALDGVYAAPGFGRSSEQLISFDGNDYRMFGNVHRTGAQHLMAIEEF